LSKYANQKITLQNLRQQIHVNSSQSRCRVTTKPLTRSLKPRKPAKKQPVGVLSKGGFGSQEELNELRRKKPKLELEIQHLQKTLVQPKQGSSVGQST